MANRNKSNYSKSNKIELKILPDARAQCVYKV